MAEGGLRERRLLREREFLRMLLDGNAARLELVDEWRRAGGSDSVRVRLLDSPAWLLDSSLAREHVVRVSFPEYFPSAPIEAWLDRPVRHPNVHPTNGFICLWAKHSPHRTVVETLLQIQRVIGWQLWNDNPEHVMQPGLDHREPLEVRLLEVPERYYLERTHAHRPEAGLRRRLSSPSE